MPVSVEITKSNRIVEIRLSRGVGAGLYKAELSVEEGPNPYGRLKLDRKQLDDLIGKPEEYGRALGAMLFSKDAIGDGFRDTLAVIHSNGETARVFLRLEDEELDGLHWERIFYPTGDEWLPLGTTSDTLFSRWIAPGDWREAGAVFDPPLRILAVISSGEDFDGDVQLISTEERALLHRTFDSLTNTSVTYLESGSEHSPTIKQLRQALLDGYHAVHFCCHGRIFPDGVAKLLLETDDGRDPWISGEQLVEAIRSTRIPPRLCFLAACESGKRSEHSMPAPIGVELARAGPVATVVAMTDSVDMTTAYEFTAAFYSSLLKHGAADRAMNEARESVRTKMDWGVPVLFLSERSGLVLRQPSFDRDVLNDRVRPLLDRYSLFGGRNRYLSLMNHHLEQNSWGYLFVTGPSGIGKTALLANWVKSLQENPHYAVCYHFISRLDDLADEDYTLRNLCQQLLAFHRLDGDLPITTSELRGWYRRVLTRPKPRKQKKLIVVLDGLDEAQGWKPGSDLFPGKLPDDTFVVFSAGATGRNWVQDLGLSTSIVEIVQLGSLQTGEISELLRSSGQKTEKLADDPTFLAALVQQSEGDPVYLHFLVQDMLKGNIATLGDLMNWPTGLDGYLSHWWDRLANASNADDVMNLIGYLVISKGRLTTRDLLQLRGEKANPISLAKIIQESQRFLSGNDAVGYSLGHPRFREYIAREHISEVLQKSFRLNLLQFCSSWRSNHSSYAVLHYPDHLLEGNETIDQLRSVLTDFEYVRARLIASDVNSLISAYDTLPDLDELRMVQRALGLSAKVLAKDPSQLASHLLGRLLGESDHFVNALLNGTRNSHGTFWLRPTTASLASSAPLLRTLTGHLTPVLKVALLERQRRWAVSASEDGILRIWHIETGEAVKSFQTEGTALKALAVLDSRRLIFASMDHRLLVWDLDAGYAVRELEGHTDVVEAVVVLESPTIISASADKTLRIWNVDTGETLQVLSGHSDCVTSIAVLDGERVISGSRDGTLRLWDILSGETLGRFTGHAAPIRAVVIAASDTAISCSSDGSINIWDINSLEALARIEAHNESVEGLVVLDRFRVMSASEDKTLRIWNIETQESSTPFFGHTDAVYSLAIVDDGRTLSASADKTLRVWDTKTDFTLRALEGHTRPIVSIAVLDDQNIVSGSTDGDLRIWNLGTHKSVNRLKRLGYGIRSLAVLNPRLIVAASEDESLWLWELDTGDIRLLEAASGQNGLIDGLAVIDPETIVFGAEDNTLRICKVSTGAVKKVLRGHTDWAREVATLGQGGIVSASADMTLRVWDVAHRKTTKILEGHTDGVEAVAVIDRRRIVSGSADRTVRIWDIETGDTVRVMTGHTDWVLGVAALDRRRVVSVSADGDICVWDSQSGIILANFRVDTEVTAIAVAPDHENFVAGDAEGRLHFLSLQKP